MAVTGDQGKVLKLTGQGDSVSFPLRVSYIRWVGGSTGNALSVTDENSTELFASVAEGSNFIDIHPLFQEVRGLTLSTLDGGSVYIYLL